LKKLELRIGWGPGKSELILSPCSDSEAILILLEACGGGLPHIFLGFSSCLGVPRHADNDPNFITSALDNIGIRYDRPLNMVEDVAEKYPFVALRLHASGI
jgi:hypothetical protein